MSTTCECCSTPCTSARTTSLSTMKFFTSVLESMRTPLTTSSRFRLATITAARLAMARAWAMLMGFAGGAPIPTASITPLDQSIFPFSKFSTTFCARSGEAENINTTALEIVRIHFFICSSSLSLKAHAPCGLRPFHITPGAPPDRDLGTLRPSPWHHSGFA
ncbi:MAG: hypothetical protein JRJ83_17030 [Deltaproteobacteria bacterium]|nr:hypothetical protein [Deltaproteobacteria bacterium]